MSMSAIVSPAAETTRHDWLSDDFQQRLSAWNHRRLDPARPHDDWQVELAEELRMRRLEGLFVEDQRGVVSAQANGAPEQVEDFINWFEALKQTGPGQNDPLFPGSPKKPRSRTCAGSSCRRWRARRASTTSSR
jgi:hypothetical protein